MLHISARKLSLKMKIHFCSSKFQPRFPQPFKVATTINHIESLEESQIVSPNIFKSLSAKNNCISF